MSDGKGRRMPGKFELKKTPKGKFMFNLKAGNGQVVLTSEQYEQKRSALDGIRSVQKNGSDDARFDRKVAKNGKPFFTLVAKNGETIGKSQMYASTATMNKGIASVKTNCDCDIDDQT